MHRARIMGYAGAFHKQVMACYAGHARLGWLLQQEAVMGSHHAQDVEISIVKGVNGLHLLLNQDSLRQYNTHGSWVVCQGDEA